MSSRAEPSDWIAPEGQDGLVSVVIPVYNRDGLIDEALDSVRKQTYRPVEVIVVDDGSEDETACVVKGWIDAYADAQGLTVRYLYQKNSGAPAARNRGIRASRGAYIQFLDSDDLLLEHKLRRGVRLLREQDVGMVYCATAVVDEDHNRRGTWGAPVRNSAVDVPEYTWHTSGPLYRRAAVQRAGPWLETLSGSQDWEYCARMKLWDVDLHFDDEVGSLHRQYDVRRISKSTFTYSYTRSAERAYDHIWRLARERNRCTAGFTARMARLYLYRALEYRSHGHPDDADRCLEKATREPAPYGVVRGLASLCRAVQQPTFSQVVLRLVRLRGYLMG